MGARSKTEQGEWYIMSIVPNHTNISLLPSEVLFETQSQNFEWWTINPF